MFSTFGYELGNEFFKFGDRARKMKIDICVINEVAKYFT
jgi:hypothetical protein